MTFKTDVEINATLRAMLADAVKQLQKVKQDVAGSDDEILKFHVETALRAALHAHNCVKAR